MARKNSLPDRSTQGRRRPPGQEERGQQPGQREPVPTTNFLPDNTTPMPRSDHGHLGAYGATRTNALSPWTLCIIRYICRLGERRGGLWRWGLGQRGKGLLVGRRGIMGRGHDPGLGRVYYIKSPGQKYLCICRAHGVRVFCRWSSV